MILVDTHVLVWLTEGVAQLGARAHQMADETLALDRLAVSAMTFWEVAMLHQRGRMQLAQPVLMWRRALMDQGVIEMPVTGEGGIAAATLPDFHADPADRFLPATALLHRATLVTADGRILTWSGSVQRHDARQEALVGRGDGPLC